MSVMSWEKQDSEKEEGENLKQSEIKTTGSYLSRNDVCGDRFTSATHIKIPVNARQNLIMKHAPPFYQANVDVSNLQSLCSLTSAIYTIYYTHLFRYICLLTFSYYIYF